MYTTFSGDLAPFYLYRDEAAIRLTVSVNSSGIHAVSVGLFDPAAKDSILESSKTADWVNAPAGSVSAYDY